MLKRFATNSIPLGFVGMWAGIIMQIDKASQSGLT